MVYRDDALGYDEGERGIFTADDDFEGNTEGEAFGCRGFGAGFVWTLLRERVGLGWCYLIWRRCRSEGWRGKGG